MKLRYTNSPDHAGFSVYTGAPWNIQPWQYPTGAVYAVSFEKFDSLEITIGTPVASGHIVVEYVTSYNVRHRRQASVSSCWSKLKIDQDTTLNLTQSGVIRWKPPTNWLIATLNDGSGRSYGGGFFGGNGLMSQGGVGYAVRIRWIDGQGGTSKGPILNNLLQRQWIVFTPPGDGTRQMVPGWDPANDVNSDGYVDDSEFSSLRNPRATARMRYESRAYTLGNMWSQRSSGCRVNGINILILTFF